MTGLPPGLDWGRMRPRSLGARPGIRRRILHGRSNYPDLLPSGLSGATRSLGECRVLWFGSRRGAGRLPTMPSLSTRDGTGKSCVERNCNDGGARYASYRGRIPGRSLGCRTCRSPRCWATALITAVSPSYRRAFERNRCDPACAGCETADRSNQDGAVRHSLRRGVSQRAAVQRRIPSDIWPSAVVVFAGRSGGDVGPQIELRSIAAEN
jgi:hypothetical protein